MEWVNVTAKSVPEAIDLALGNLGVDETEAEIEVLEEPKQGLFGRTRGTARVKARVKPRQTRPKVERGRRNTKSSAKKSTQRKAKDDSGSKSSSNGSSRQSRGRDESKRDESKRDESKRGGERSERGRGQGSSSSSDRGGRNRKQGQGAATAKAKEASMQEVSDHIESFLAGLTEAFGLDGGVQVISDPDNGLVGQVNNRHGVMVGPRGRTLDAIQELTRVTAQRTAPSNIRIKVDVGGYREMRADALRKFALDAADAARGDGVERSLEPMSAADRKVVHDALNGVDGIETRSAGTEPRRRVVVVPLEVADDEVADDEVVEDEVVEGEEMVVEDEVEAEESEDEVDDTDTDTATASDEEE